jgi:hypothetical protein
MIFNAYIYYYTFKSPCPTQLEVVASYLEFISFILCYHVGYSVWLTFYIEISSMCFQIIHDDLDLLPTGMRFADGRSYLRLDKEVRKEEEPPPGFGSSFGIDRKDQLGGEREALAIPDESKELELTIRRAFATYELIEEHMQKLNAHFGITLIFETYFNFVCRDERLLRRELFRLQFLLCRDPGHLGCYL